MSRLARCLGVLSAALLALAAVCVSAPRLEASENLLVNPGFEEPLGDHPWMPAGWDTSQAGFESVLFNRDEFSAHTGKFGVSVANASTVLPFWHNWSQTIDVTPAMWNKDMVLTVWTKNNGVDGRGYVLIQAFRDTVGKMARLWKMDRYLASRRSGFPGVNDPVIDLAWQREAFSEKETDWVQRKLRVYLPPTCHLITVHLGLFGVGQVLFDDASLTLEEPQPAVEPPMHVNLLQDPGFEGNTLAWELSMPPYPSFLAIRDSSLSHTGKACMHFHCEAGMSVGQAGVAQVFCNRALSGKRLKITGYAKCDSLRSQIFVQLYSHTKTGFERQTSPFRIYGTTDWTPISLEADIPPDTYSVWAWIEYAAPVPGHAYFDDLSLEVLGPATGAPTPGSIPETAKQPTTPRRGTTPVKPKPKSGG